MQTKTNKNGVKLLAAVMVFAMAFAGIMIVSDGSDSDAAVTTTGAVSIGEKDYNNLSEALKAAVDKDIITAKAAIVISGDKLVIDKNITINTAGFSFTVAVDGTIEIADGKIVTITNASTSGKNLIEVVGSSSRSVDAIIIGTGSTLNLNDTADKHSVIYSKTAPSTITLKDNSKLNYNGLAGVQSMNYVAQKGSKIDATSISDKATLAGYFDLTGATVNAKNIGVYAATLKEKSVINATQLGVYNGDKEPSSINTSFTQYTVNTVNIASGSSITVDKIVYGLDGEPNGTANLKFTGAGVLSGDITLLKGEGSLDLQNVTYSGVVSNIDKGKTHSVTLSNIIAPGSSGLVLTAGSVEINGSPVTSVNGKIIVSSGDAKITGTVPAGVTLVIEEDATVLSTSEFEIALNATMEVYGTVEAATITNNGKVVVTPTSKVDASISGDIVQNADMDKPFLIGGELDVSMPVGNATVNGKIHIPEGKTLTVTGNLFLNGGEILVDGELIVNKGACIYDIVTTGKITIGKGTITNNGIIGNEKPIAVFYGAEKAVEMKGVAGVNFETKDGKIIISGEISRITAVENNTLSIYNAVVGDLTVSKKVTLVLAKDSVETTNGSTVTIDGAIEATSSNKTLSLGIGSSFTLNGSNDGTVIVSATTGELENNTTFKLGTTDTVTIKAGSNSTGFTIYTKKVAITDGSDTSYFMRAYIEGSLGKYTTPQTIVTANQTFTITGEFYVASGSEIVFSKDVTIDNTQAFNVIVEGSIVFEEEDTNILKGKYIGAHYIITTGEGSNKTSTAYYTTFNDAIAKIADVDDKTVESTISEIVSDFTVLAGQKVIFNGVTVSSKAVVNIEAEGTVEKISTVEGKVIVKDGAFCTIPSTGYAAKTVSSDNTVTYAGLKIAIENAVSGDVVTISSGETKESLTIPAGVTVTVTNDLKVGGNLTVSEGSKLIIKGMLSMTSTTKDVTTEVIGTLDASNGTYAQGDKSTLKSSGTSVFQSITNLRFNGAYYNNADGNVVITTVSKAVEGAVAAGEDTVTVEGTVNDSTEITLKDMKLVLNDEAIVKLGNVNIENATIDADATDAKLTATIIGMNGDADKAVSSSVKTSESNIVVIQTSTVKADETVSNKFTISGVSGTVTIATGNVNLASDVTMDAASKDKIIISQGAVLTVDKDMTVNGGSIIIDGTVDVVGKKLTLKSENAEINGTVNVTKNGEVDLKKAVINGTIDVKTEKDKTNKLTISVNKFEFGKAIESIGATATIIGNVEIDTSYYVIAYSGIDLSKAIFNADEDGNSTAVTTTYIINGVEYATVYAFENNDVAISSVFDPSELDDIKGLNFNGFTIVWTDASGQSVGTSNIGDVGSVMIDVPVAKKKVTVSVGTGISLYIDGVNYASGSTPELTVGEHKVTATVNPGYKGTVDIMVNGVKVTSGTFTVSLDADTVISATGDITVNTGDAPAQKDDGMGLTDYLLIVLVILAAILVVVVAIRMMRS